MKKYMLMCFVCFYVLSFVSVFGETIGDRMNLFRPTGGMAEKLVVTDSNAVLYRTIGDRGEPLEPLRILWRFKIDGADEKNPVKTVNGKEYYRVGGPTGIEYGWVEASKVTSWNTRLVFAPLPPRPDCVFSVFDKSYSRKSFFVADKAELEEHTIAKIVSVPQGLASFAFVLDEKGGSTYGDRHEFDPEIFRKVMLYTGPVNRIGKRETSPSFMAKELELDIVFVIDTTKSTTQLVDLVQKSCHKFVKIIQKDKKNSSKIHFGLVEYRDSTSGHKEDAFGARVVCDVASTHKEFLKALDGLTFGHGGDIPDEVILGLRTAVDDITWHEHSSKHIILVGDAPNKKTPKTGEINTFKKLYDYANVDVGGDDQSNAFNTKWFHAILGGNNKEAENEWEEIADNRGRGMGFFGNMKDPALLEDLVDVLTAAFDAIPDPDKLVSDEYPSAQVWALVKKQGAKGHAAGRPKTLEGYACARSADKQQVADMNVMILREELESFQEDLQTAYRRFKTLCAGADGNQKKIFDEFIEEYTGAAAGENEEYYDKNLLEIIGAQLPVQSAALQMTFRDVRAMPPDMFTLWISEIKTSADRAKAILDKKDLWISPNTTDPNVMDDDRFAFVPVVYLP